MIIDKEIDLSAPVEDAYELHKMLFAMDTEILISDNIMNTIQQQAHPTNTVLGFLQHQNSTLFLLPQAKEILIPILINYLNENNYLIHI